MKHYLNILCSLILFSCQEEITLDLPQAENKIVVEGSIEPGFPPYIILTKNEGYFDPIPSNYPSNIYINDVDSIKVWYYSDEGEKIIKFLEQIPQNALQLIPGLDSIPPLYSVNDYDFFSENPTPYEFSKEERTYYLEIKWNNKIITSETTIPKSTPLDSIWVKQSEQPAREYKCDIRAIYSDPANEQNNILIKSKRIQHYERNSKDTILCETINYPDFPLKLVDSGSDILINGQSFETYFPRPKESGFPTGAYNSNYNEECDNTLLEFKEDVVLIKFCKIDEASMKFWRGLVRQAGTNGNPFSEPSNLVSNIRGGLGIWAGYSPVYYKVPVVIDTTIFDQYIPKIIDIF